MGRINVLSRRKDYRFVDKIYLANDKSIYVSLDLWKVVIIDEKGKEKPIAKNRRPGYFIMLRLLIERNGMVVSPDDLYYEIKGCTGPDVKPRNYTLDELVDVNLDDDVDIDKVVYDNFKELNKQQFIKSAKEKGLSIKKLSTKNDGANGYILELPAQGDNLDEEFDVDEKPLRPILTDTMVPDALDIIYRDSYVERIDKMIKENVKAISLSGFGGIGKTSLAQLLYKKYVDESDETFSHIGYVNYSGDLKSSMLAAMPYMYDDIEMNARWNHIAVRLKNSKGRKLLIIDNVDRDNKISQNPLSEKESAIFQEIAGWPNMTVILTTRLREIPGYKCISVNALGDDDNVKPCVDLFNLYNSKFVNRTDKIIEIVKKCNYHTYAIELVAKSARNCANLDAFVRKFSDNKFYYTNSNIKTRYKRVDHNTTAAIQIRNLFDFSCCNEAERNIIKKFAILPDMVRLSLEDINEWFSYNGSDLFGLVDGGWIQCLDDTYYIHPLVKEAILLEYNNEDDMKNLDESVAGNIITFLEKKIFFDENADYSFNEYRVRIAESVLKHICIEDKLKEGIISLYVADEARKMSKRAIALELYTKAETVLHKIVKKLDDEQRVYHWKATYYRGYLLSYTNSKFEEAEKYIKAALDISEKMYKANPCRYNMEYLATSLDHYGYILSNTMRDDEAEVCLSKALEFRVQLDKEYPGEYKQKVAWSADNLGFLLTFRPDGREKGEELLELALKYRIELADYNPSSEVAWTYSNLACLYLMGGYNYDRAVSLSKAALSEYYDLQRIAPGSYNADISYISNNYGIILLKGFCDSEKAIQQLETALALYRRLEKENPNSYFQEQAMVCSNIACIRQMGSNETSKEIEAYYLEAISVLENHYKESKNSSENRDIAVMLADISYNYWVYMLRDESYADERRRCKRDVIRYWRHDEDALNDPNVKRFIDNNNDFVEEKNVFSDIDYPVILYIQGGARKKRIWSDSL